jgi:2-oxoglutarate ferredoxin oxidoreductase subunit alpha
MSEPTTQLMNGSKAIMQAALAAGCRFYSGYPMTPSTKLLDAMSEALPKVGGVCLLAESEIEAAAFAWGASATGARAAVGGCGQGLALMQEQFSEIAVAELPLVIFNMARGQGDYFQSTRGGGHGDYRHIVLSPLDINEAVQLTSLAFYLADKWRIPVLLHGDYLVAHGTESVNMALPEFPPLPPKDWALDGATGGSGEAKLISPFVGKKSDSGAHSDGVNLAGMHKRLYAKLKRIAAAEQRLHSEWLEDAEVLVTAWGGVAKFVRYAVKQLRDDGHKLGFLRPISLWPYPSTEVARIAEGRKKILVFEVNTGQMVDDVKLSVLGRCPVEFIGDYSTDPASFGIGELLDVDAIRGRILAALEGRTLEAA